jgi:very-short-patch-repair endonuclease
MDFLLLLPDNVRVVIEVDGKHHYSRADRPAPDLYGQMMEEDRRLRLSGYELYRFGGAEFADTQFLDGTHTVGAK